MQAISSAEIVTTTVTGVAVPTLFLGSDPVLMFSFVNLMQTLFYLLFLNVEYPKNFQSFLDIFKFARLNFIPNPLSLPFNIKDEDLLDSPPKFFDNEFSGLFVYTGGGMVCLMLVSLFTYLVSLVISSDLCFSKQNCFKKYFRKLRRYFEWSGLLQAWITIYFEMMFASLLQLHQINFQTAFFGFSSICGILVFTTNFFFVFLIYKISKQTQVPNSRSRIKKFEAIFQDYDANKAFSKSFLVVLIARKFLQAIIIVELYQIPILQTTATGILGTVIVISLLALRPHNRTSLNVGESLNEIMLLLVHSTTVFFALNDAKKIVSNDQKEKLGFFLIIVCMVVILYQVVLIVQEIFMSIRDLVLKYKRSKRCSQKNSKQYPQQDRESKRRKQIGLTKVRSPVKKKKKFVRRVKYPKNSQKNVVKGNNFQDV